MSKEKTVFHDGWNVCMRKDLHKLLNNFQGERRVSVETFYIYEYEIKSKYIFLYCMVQHQSYDFNTIAIFF